MSLVPLIDIVFNLIVFFVLSANFVRRPGEVDLPRADLASAEPRGMITLSLTEDGRLYLDGVETRVSDLPGALGSLVAADPGTRLTIQADTDVGYGRLFGLLEQVRHAGVREIGLGYEPRP